MEALSDMYSLKTRNNQGTDTSEMRGDCNIYTSTEAHWGPRSQESSDIQKIPRKLRNNCFTKTYTSE